MFSRANNGAGIDLPSLTSINIDDIDDKELENFDFGHILSSKVSLPDDISADMNSVVSLEEVTNPGLAGVCSICMQDKPSEMNQLIECSKCSKKYHTTCVNLPQIPFSTLVPMERRKRDDYIELHYKNWLCPSCRDTVVTAPLSPSLTPSQPMSPRHRISSFSSPRFESPLPLSPDLSSVSLNNSDSNSQQPSLPRSFFYDSPSKIMKATGSDLSQGGVIVGTKEYYVLQKTFQNTYNQQQQPIQPTPAPQPHVEHLRSDLVPIFTDSDSDDSDDKTVSYTNEDGQKKRIRASKLAGFLRSILNESNKKEGSEDYVDDVVNQVMTSKDIDKLSAICPIPLFVLQSMIQSAAFKPSSSPFGKVSFIDGKEVVRISEHPQLKTFFERLNNGEDKESIEKDMIAEGVSTDILSKDPDDVVLVDDYSVSFIRSDRIQTPTSEEQDDIAKEAGLLLSEHAEFKKYFRMLQMNIPEKEVIQCMLKDGLDPSVLKNHQAIDVAEESVTPASSVPVPAPVPTATVTTVKKVKLCDHPKYSKYFNMKSKGLPDVAVRHAMRRDHIDESILDKDPNEEIEIEIEESASAPTDTKVNTSIQSKGDTTSSKEDDSEDDDINDPIMREVRICEHPDYADYFQLLSRGIPKLFVARMMKKANKDVTVLDKDPDTIVEVEVLGYSFL